MLLSLPKHHVGSGSPPSFLLTSVSSLFLAIISVSGCDGSFVSASWASRCVGGVLPGGISSGVSAPPSTVCMWGAWTEQKGREKGNLFLSPAWVGTFRLISSDPQTGIATNAHPPGSQAFGPQVNDITCFPEPSAYRRQIIGLLSLRDRVSQFFIINLFLNTHPIGSVSLENPD